jgi:hypothetical protein
MQRVTSKAIVNHINSWIDISNNFYEFSIINRANARRVSAIKTKLFKHVKSINGHWERYGDTVSAVYYNKQGWKVTIFDSKLEISNVNTGRQLARIYDDEEFNSWTAWLYVQVMPKALSDLDLVDVAMEMSWDDEDGYSELITDTECDINLHNTNGPARYNNGNAEYWFKGYRMPNVKCWETVCNNQDQFTNFAQETNL